MKNRLLKLAILGCLAVCVGDIQANIVNYKGQDYDLDAAAMREYKACFYAPNKEESLQAFFGNRMPEAPDFDVLGSRTELATTDFSQLPPPPADASVSSAVKQKPKVAPKPTPAPKPVRLTAQTAPVAVVRAQSPIVNDRCCSGEHSATMACSCKPEKSVHDAQQDALTAKRMALRRMDPTDERYAQLAAELEELSLALAIEEQERANDEATQALINALMQQDQQVMEAPSHPLSRRPSTPVRAPMEFGKFKDSKNQDQRTAREIAEALQAEEEVLGWVASEAATEALLAREARETLEARIAAERATEEFLEAARKEAQIERLYGAYKTALALKAEYGQEAVLNMVAGDFEEAERDALQAALMHDLAEDAARELLTNLL